MIRARLGTVGPTAAILVLHAGLVVWLFGGWSRLWDPEQPCLFVDHAIHQYHGWLGAHFMRTAGTNWGYDPYFLAGYPKTPIYEASSLPAEILAWLAGPDWDPVMYKVGTAVYMVLALLLVTGAAASTAGSAGAVAVATFLAGLYWWDGFPAVLYISGMYGFCLGASLAVLAATAMARYTAGAGLGAWAIMTVAGALACLTHVAAVTVLAPAAAGLYLVRLTRLGWRRQAGLWLAAAAILALNAFWVVPFLRFAWIKTPSTLFMQDPTPWAIVSDLFLSNRDSFALPLLVVLALVGYRAFWQAGRRDTAVALALGAGFMGLEVYFGSLLWPFNELEPRRFKWPLAAYLAPAAGQGLVWLWAGLRSAWRPAGQTAPGDRRVWALALIGLAVVLGRSGPVERTIGHWAQQWALAAPMPAECRRLVDWIRSHTDRSARILFEDQLRLRERTPLESLHWTPLLPLLTQREYIGGLYQCGFILHHHASFGDFHIKGQAHQPIDAVPEAELREFCQRYNVGWVVAWSPRARAVFDALTWAVPMAVLPRPTRRPEENQWRIYRLESPAGYFAVGHGTVRADYNRLELTDLRPVGGRVVLRYHWLETFRSDPPFPLSAERIGDDPIGFIRIDGLTPPPPRLVLYNSYRWSDTAP